MPQTEFPEATTLEAIECLQEATAKILGALRRAAAQHEAQDAGAREYGSWAGALEYDSWSASLRNR